MEPLLSLFGVANAFWLAYMASSALFIYALVRLTRRLISDRSLANLGLIALAAIPLPYGGWEIFIVQENFFTARLVAEGFCLIGIEAILAGRTFKAVGFSLIGIAFHPLMGISSLLIVMGIFFWHRLRLKTVVYLSIALILGMLTLVLFVKWNSILQSIPRMDELWLFTVKNRSRHCFPSEWRIVDWYWLVGSLIITLWACRWLSPRSRILVRMAVFVSLAGLLSSAVGEYLSYPLLLQGQGFRAFWIIEVLTIPLGMILISRLSSRLSIFSTCACIGVFVFLGDPFFLCSRAIPFSPALFWICLLSAGIAAFFLFRDSSLARIAAIKYALYFGFVTTATTLSVVMIAGIIKSGWNQAMEPMFIAYNAGYYSSRTFLFIIALLFMAGVLFFWKKPVRVLLFSISFWFCLSFALSVFQNSQFYRARFELGYKDVPFVAETIKNNAADLQGNLKTKQLYWPTHKNLIWFELNSNSYYSVFQLAGSVFSRMQSIEGQRRASLVKPFEVAALKNKFDDINSALDLHLRVLNGSLNDPPPTRDDLLHLAKDEMLDWIILDQGFDGLYSATNGSIYVYDCSRIRMREHANKHFVEDGIPE
jgi:hypothetical protein